MAATPWVITAWNGLARTLNGILSIFTPIAAAVPIIDAVAIIPTAII